MGLVRKPRKQQTSSPEVAKVATSMSKSDVKDFASTKHKGLPEKKKIAEGKRDGKGAKSKGYSSAIGLKVVDGFKQVVSTMVNHVRNNQDRKQNHIVAMQMIVHR